MTPMFDTFLKSQKRRATHTFWGMHAFNQFEIN